jgi:pyruvate carboxylase subunit B
MKYSVTVGTRSFEVELDGATVKLDGEVWHASLEMVPGAPLGVVRRDDGTRTVVLKREGTAWAVAIAGERFIVRVLDEHAQRARDLAGDRHERGGAGVVRAPMPGLVLRLEVVAGDPVGAGTGLVVLEAMKMENEIRSPGPGVVRSVLVAPGQVVEKGAPLVEIAGG